MAAGGGGRMRREYLVTRGAEITFRLLLRRMRELFTFGYVENAHAFL